MSQGAPINLLVASVLNDNQVVLNGGRNKGVANGQSYVIYTVGPEIKDPATGRSLGTVELVRGRVHVIQVQEELSVASTEKNDVSIAPEYPGTSIIAQLKPKLQGVKIGDQAKRVS